MMPISAKAETLVDSKRATPIATSTAKAGGRDDIRIAPAGSIEVKAGAAVTLDSANSVKNEGSISIKDASNATGILGAAGANGEIVNSGKIVLDETYASVDADKDGDGDGPFSKQSGNAGIRTAGAFSGNVTNSGSIFVRGNQSAGILLGGQLSGGLTQLGSIEVAGDGAAGIRTGAVTGSVKVLGSIAVQGAGASGLSVEGTVGGLLLIQSSIVSTGYRSSTAPADASKLDADDLLQGGPAVKVAGSVAGGILFDVRPKDGDPKDPDEDKDGVEDAKEGNSSIASYGAAPAILVGSATNAVSIGGLAGPNAGFGLVVNGEVLGSGVYKGVDGTAVQIGGTGGAVAIAGGLSIGGNVAGKSVDANATGLIFGSGASAPRLSVSGSVGASSGAGAKGLVRAVSIGAGASLATLTNTGTISATASGDATATAIHDASGTLTLIENGGTIAATSKRAAADGAVAIDLQANTSGATVRQKQATAGSAAPRIVGAVLFGSGDDSFEVADGHVIGTTRFGAGNNSLSLSGDTVLQGDVSFGAGADAIALTGTSVLAGVLDLGGGADRLSLGGTSVFSGRLLNAAGAAMALSGGVLDVRNTGTVQLASLTATGGSTIGVTIDPSTRAATQYQVGSASFDKGTKVAVSVSSVGRAEGDYVIVKAGSLTGGSNLSASGALLPYMFKGTLAANDAAGQVSLKVERKTASELGLTRSQAAAYDAVFNVLDKDAKVAGVFLAIREQAGFQGAVQQMLPDHAGGVFDTVTRGSRTLGSYLADPNAAVAELGSGVGFWIQQAAWGTSKRRGQSASYRSSGWGASGGVEVETSFGRIGGSVAYLNGKASQRHVGHQVDSHQYEGSVHWRNAWGGLHAYARASAATVNVRGSREFVGQFAGEAVSRRTGSSWDGTLYTGSAGLSYQLESGRFSVRPAASFDYFRLNEDGHAEKGGGETFDLVVGSRTSDELAVTGTIAAAIDFDRSDDGVLRLEVEGGRREIVAGSLGRTTASFKGGKEFTLDAEPRQSSWVGKVRLVGGGEGLRVSGEGSAEEQYGRAALGFRASVSVGF